MASVASLAGCRNDASDSLAQRALQPAARSAQQSLDKIRGATLKGAAITGWDEHHRPAWRLSSRESRIGAGQDPSSPTRATLLGARADLFRDGVLESSFQAEKIELVTESLPPSTPGGKPRSRQRLLLSGGVRAQGTPPKSMLQSTQKSTRKSGQKPGNPVLAAAPVTLEAPGAVVSLSDKTVWVPASAVLRQEASGVRIEARTLRADSGLKRVQMSAALASSPQGRVRADRALLNWGTRRLLATGHVRAQAPITPGGQATTNLLLSGDRLDADASGGDGLLSGSVRAVAQPSSQGGAQGGAQGGQIGQIGQASASQIRFNWRRKSVRAQGGVTMQKDGATLRAQEISTDADFASATASGGVRLSRDGSVITADRVRASDKFTRAVASGGVALSTSTSDGPTTVRAARVEALDDFTRAVASGGVTLRQGASTVRADSVQAFDLKGAGRAVARGSVELVRDDLTVRAPSVDAANLRDRSGLVVAASGGVRASSQGRTASARSVRWAGGRVEASGGVSLRQKQATLRGDRLSGDDRFENAILTGHVGGTLPSGGQVSAGRIEKSGDKITAIGGVRAQQQGFTLRVARLESTASGSDAVGSGGVVLTTKDGTTLSAPTARYNKARDEAYAEEGARYVDRAAGLDVTGNTVLVRHVADEKRRTATIDGAQGSGSEKALGGLKF